jgi:hypothetical protein
MGQGIETLAQYAFESTSISTSREALRCLANALLLKEETRQILVDCGAAPKAAEKLKVGLSCGLGSQKQDTDEVRSLTVATTSFYCQGYCSS